MIGAFFFYALDTDLTSFYVYLYWTDDYNIALFNTV